MKRIISLMAALLLFALIVIPASAEGEVKLYLEGPSSVKVGDTFDVTVNISGTYKASILNLRVFFDNTSFKYVRKANGPVIEDARDKGGICLIDVNMEGNAISIGLMMPTDEISEPGQIVKITFEALSKASPKVDFALEVEEFSYMPLGETHANNIACESTGIEVSVSGGSGSGTTPIPVNTPKPAGTNAPSDKTPSTAQPTQSGDSKSTIPPLSTDLPAADGTDAPAETDPAVTEQVTDPTQDAQPGEATQAPEPAEPTPARSANPLLIAGGAVLAAALIVLCVLLVKRAKLKKK